nr:AraC family transcriptional regulator [Mastigocladopsis repens]
MDLPLCGCAIEATPEQPYLGFKLDLDPVQLCDIIAQTNPGIDKKENSVKGWFISDAEPSLIDCAIRLTRLLDTPQDIPFLAPMIVREIYYRLLSRAVSFHKGKKFVNIIREKSMSNCDGSMTITTEYIESDCALRSAPWAIALITERLAGALPRRMVESSSSRTTSFTQCRQFSILQ